MPLRESEAIVLQSYALGEADRLVSFLSRTVGRVRGVAAGARRPKSRFGSTLERMSHVHVWFFERETRDLVRINQCELVESFVSVFRDYAAGVALTLCAEITEAVLPEREPADAHFRLLLLTAQTIKRTREADLPLAYFVLWAVRLGGWLGSFERCGRCGEPLGSATYASASVPGVQCDKCRTAGSRSLPEGIAVAANKMLNERLDKLGPGDFSKPVLHGLLEYCLNVVEHQIERKLKAREVLESVF